MLRSRRSYRDQDQPNCHIWMSYAAFNIKYHIMSNDIKIWHKPIWISQIDLYHILMFKASGPQHLHQLIIIKCRNLKLGQKECPLTNFGNYLCSLRENIALREALPSISKEFSDSETLNLFVVQWRSLKTWYQNQTNKIQPSQKKIFF